MIHPSPNNHHQSRNGFTFVLHVSHPINTNMKSGLSMLLDFFNQSPFFLSLDFFYAHLIGLQHPPTYLHSATIARALSTYTNSYDITIITFQLPYIAP